MSGSNMKQNENTADLFVKKVINYYKIYKNIVSKQINLDSYPMEIFFETSNLCNANCIMCAKFSAYLFDRLNKEERKKILSDQMYELEEQKKTIEKTLKDIEEEE